MKKSNLTAAEQRQEEAVASGRLNSYRAAKYCGISGMTFGAWAMDRGVYKQKDGTYLVHDLDVALDHRDYNIARTSRKRFTPRTEEGRKLLEQIWTPSMRRRRGESKQEFWERKVAADPDIIVTDATVEVLHRLGESQEDYNERWLAASPPLSESQKATIRAAADEYWSMVREEARRRSQ